MKNGRKKLTTELKQRLDKKEKTLLNKAYVIQKELDSVWSIKESLKNVKL